MDIDISDILADVSRSAHETSYNPLAPHPNSYQQHQTHYDPESAYADHVLLTRHWTSERCTPTLLPYPTRLIDRVMDRVRSQISRIEDLTSGIYDSTTMGGGGGGGGISGANTAPANLNLTLSILQTDLSRTQFLLRSYLRQRLAKITKHATYYAKYHSSTSASSSTNNNNNNEQDTKSNPLLSPTEQQFLQHHNALLHNLYHSSFLSSLPVNLRRLDDSSSGGNTRMDEGPDGAEGVMVRCLAGEWSNEREIEAAAGDNDDGGGIDGEKPSVELRCERGGILVARWRDVRGGVEAGDLEVL